jgi:hypothetical protein
MYESSAYFRIWFRLEGNSPETCIITVATRYLFFFLNFDWSAPHPGRPPPPLECNPAQRLLWKWPLGVLPWWWRQGVDTQLLQDTVLQHRRWIYINVTDCLILQHLLYGTATTEKAVMHNVASKIRKWPHRPILRASSSCCMNLWIRTSTMYVRM